MKAMIKAERDNNGLKIQVEGTGQEVLFLISAIVNQSAEDAHIPVEEVTEMLVKSISAYKLAKSITEKNLDCKKGL